MFKNQIAHLKTNKEFYIRQAVMFVAAIGAVAIIHAIGSGIVESLESEEEIFETSDSPAEE